MKKSYWLVIASMALIAIVGQRFRSKDTPDIATSPPGSEWIHGTPAGTTVPYFEQNRGQTDPEVEYFIRNGSCPTWFKQGGSMICLLSGQDPERSSIVRMELPGSDPLRHGHGKVPARSISNYFIGNEPDQWISDIPHYKEIAYKGIYPGIDLVYYFNEGKVEFDFRIAPNTPPKVIRMSFNGADRCEIDPNGNLSITSGDGELILEKPRAWQELDSGREPVRVRYAMLEETEIGFELGTYHDDHTLVIDPKVVYATYLGGSHYDRGSGIAVDAAGCAYVTGTTTSADFPLSNAFQPHRGIGSSGSGNDVFVAKFSADGSQLIYATYFGGWGEDVPHAIAVDSEGNASITGRTASSDRSSTPEADGLPLKNPYQNEIGGTANMWDAFITVFGPQGDELLYSTFLGGKQDDEAMDIVVDSSGALYVTGTTFSSDFPTRNPFQANWASYYFDAFATKLDPFSSGEQSLIYSTYIGGDLDDYGAAIAVDPEGYAYITGEATSTDFPTTENPIQGAKSGSTDAFLIKLSPDGASAIFSTYLGGDGGDEGYDIVTDREGNPYLYGFIGQPFPVDQEPFGYTGRMLGKLYPDGSGFQYATYVPAYGWSMAVDDFGQVHIGGYLQDDIRVFVMNAEGTDSLFTVTMGGSDSESAQDIALGPGGEIYLTGSTKSLDFPVKNAYQENYGDDTTGFVKSDAFVVKLAMEIERDLRVDPNPVFFPLTFPGETSREVVQVYNPSDADIEIQSMEVDPATQFTIENKPELPLILDPGGKTEFTVAYSPDGGKKGQSSPEASPTGTLTIISDGDTPELIVPLEASGLIINDAGDEPDYDLLDGVCDCNEEKPGNQCTMRGAIQNVNYLEDAEVTFVYVRIPGESGAEISPESPLPPIRYPIHFDVGDQDGAVLLDGSKSDTANGLEILSGHCYLEHFIFANWKGNGLLIQSGDWNYLDHCTFRYNSAGEGRKIAGIHIQESAFNQIRECAMYGNHDYGIWISGADSRKNKIETCMLGYNQFGDPGSILQETGIFISEGGGNEVLGSKIGYHQFAGIYVKAADSTLIAGNHILRNQRFGIRLHDGACCTKVSLNLIGAEENGLIPAPNEHGISVTGGCNQTHIERNLISGNRGRGILAEGTSNNPLSDMLIEHNIIGLDSTGAYPLPNKAGIFLLGKCRDNRIEWNTISGNTSFGISISSGGKSSNRIYDNIIGTDTSGLLVLPSGNVGLGIYKSSGNFVSRNTICGSHQVQLQLIKVRSGYNWIMYNEFGTDRQGGAPENVPRSSGTIGIYSLEANSYITGNLIAYRDIGFDCREGSEGYFYENEVRENLLGVRVEKSMFDLFLNHIHSNNEGLEVIDSEPLTNFIAGNMIHDNQLVNTGIHLTNAPARVMGNYIFGDAGNGIVVEGNSLPMFHWNNIMDNEGLGIHQVGSGTTIDARNNWWGSADGPGGEGPGSGDGVSLWVNYSGWREEPVSLFVTARRDTNRLAAGFNDIVYLFFQNWSTPYDDVQYEIEIDKPWLVSPELDTAQLSADWGEREIINFLIPEGTPVGSVAHVEVHALSLNDGSRDTTRFVVKAGSRELTHLLLLPDTVTVEAGDTAYFDVTAVNQFYWTAFPDLTWHCDGGTFHYDGMFVAGPDSGWYDITVTDPSTGISSQAQVHVVEEISAVGISRHPVTEVYGIQQNYPNPFSRETWVPYRVSERTRVTIEVYNLVGQKICILADGVHQPGDHRVKWDGTDESGVPVPSGIYIYQISTDRYRKSLKMYKSR